MSKQHNPQRPIISIMSTCGESRSSSMPPRHRACAREVLHSTGNVGDSHTTYPDISPGFPDLPLAEWSGVELERYFDGLIAMVMCEGEAQ